MTPDEIAGTIPPDRLEDRGQRYEVGVGDYALKVVRVVVWSDDLIDAEGLMKTVLYLENAEGAAVYDRIAGVMVRRELRQKPGAGLGVNR